MPELPEVEVVRRELLQWVKGREILGVESLDPKFVLPSERVEKKVIQDVLRKGKFLFFQLDDGNWILSHLGMTGRFVFSQQKITSPYLRFVFCFHGNWLFYLDTRKFGRLQYLTSQEQKVFWEKIGIDPLSSEFTLENFLKLFEGKKTQVKSFLMDQHYVAGLGNIYVNEILFRSGIHPRTPVSTLSTSQKERLFVTILEVLKKAIALQGTTIRDFSHGEGEEGGFQEFLLVYGKANCPVCGREIKREKIQSRSTFFCSFCQRTQCD
ncbi:MAG: formamidopyrimidine-DNA glycosylase [Candidatus Atribacteria bacterium]|nr:formamidopyrimidine-DNA glycosylase [Candidatus Atribacteria bacterium]